jgi:hypothetical protein
LLERWTANTTTQVTGTPGSPRIGAKKTSTTATASELELRENFFVLNGDQYIEGREFERAITRYGNAEQERLYEHN